MPEWFEVALRGLLFLGVLFIMTKILGKKQLSQLSFFEYVAGITIGSIGAEVVTGLDRNIFHGVVGIIVFTLVPFLVAVLSMKSKKFRTLVEGEGVPFIQNGKVLEDNLKKERYSTDELLELLRKKDVFRVADVEFAVLEATGDLSVMLKKEHQPLTPNMLGVTVAPVKEPQTVIMDGKVLDEPLASMNLNRGWLKGELDKIGVTIENVFLGQVDSSGQLTVDLFNDKLQVPPPQEKPMLLAAMKKCQADLELFALATEAEEAKAMYAKNSEKLKKTIEQVTPFLKS
ncbi:DUF421 domain-containing protein [Domibacillus indicus]|uniref:DUF421 domain-containing protein n=1 Tax=Domibacillus indicus TaxID=1437523 RepID=UPI000617FC43|nr:DUF421 domain-containing protein [Domibacillus indicus]